MIEKGSVVTVHYTGKLKSGEEFDSSVGREPFTFEVGSRQVIPGFENGLIGKGVGEKVTVDIPSNEAYGDFKEDLLMKVPNSQLPGKVVVGQDLQARNGDNLVNVSVKEVNEDHVIIDGNHPLAGKDLVFDIEVLEIQ